MLAILPDITLARVPSVGFRLAIPPSYATVGEDLRRLLPTPIVEALDRIVDKIHTHICDPLLCAPDPEHLLLAFQRLFPRFADEYLCVVFLVWAEIEQDPHRFLALGMRSLDESQALTRNRGGRWLGPAGTQALLSGLHTMGRVARGAATGMDQGDVSLDPGGAEAMARTTIAYTMTTSTVLYALAREDESRGRPENIAYLANWSKGYALQVYEWAKRLGLLRPRVASGPLPGEGDEEDRSLAEAGLVDYARLLAREDEP